MMNENDKQKKWDAICDEVAKSVERTYLSIPLGKRKQLGVEPDKSGKFPDSDSYDRNRWMVCYISLMEWQKQARMLFNQQFIFSDDENT